MASSASSSLLQGLLAHAGGARTVNIKKMKLTKSQLRQIIKEELEEGIGSRLSALEREAEEERSAAKAPETEPEQEEPEAEKEQPSKEDAAAQKAETAVGKLGVVLQKHAKIYKEISQFLEDYKSNQFEDDQDAIQFGLATLSENQKTRKLIDGNVKAGNWTTAVKAAMKGLEQAIKQLAIYKKLLSGGQGDAKGLANLLNAFNLDYEAAQAVESAYLESLEPQAEESPTGPTELSPIRAAAAEAGMDPLKYIRLRALGKLPTGTPMPRSARPLPRPRKPGLWSRLKKIFKEELEKELVEKLKRSK